MLYDDGGLGDDMVWPALRGDRHSDAAEKEQK
jgi:hypothetical protein